MANTNKLERLENMSEIIYFLDNSFLMLVDKDYTQLYDANAETRHKHLQNV